MNYKIFPLPKSVEFLTCMRCKVSSLACLEFDSVAYVVFERNIVHNGMFLVRSVISDYVSPDVPRNVLIAF